VRKEMIVHCGNSLVYCKIEIENGYIKSIYEEMGREGGYTYRKFGVDSSSLQECMNYVAYNWPASKYLTVQKEAYKEHLLDYDDAVEVIKNRIRDRLRTEINMYTERTINAQMELNALK
jgi:hypothetical protein